MLPRPYAVRPTCKACDSGLAPCPVQVLVTCVVVGTPPACEAIPDPNIPNLVYGS